MGAELDLGPLIVWAAAISTLLSLGTAVWTMMSSPARRNDARLVDLALKLDTIAQAQATRAEIAERRLQRLEDQMAERPNREMMHRLELSLERMEGHIGMLDERLKPVAAIAERMQEVMLAQSKSH